MASRTLLRETPKDSARAPFRGQFVPVAEMAFRHELPEAFRELLIAPGADARRKSLFWA